MKVYTYWSDFLSSYCIDMKEFPKTNCELSAPKIFSKSVLFVPVRSMPTTQKFQNIECFLKE